MAGASKHSVLAATAAVATLGAVPVFIAPTSGALRGHAGAAVNLAHSASAASETPSSFVAPAGAAAVLSAACAGGAQYRGRGRAARKVAATSAATPEPSVTEEAEKAPAPPPFDPSKQYGVTEPLGYFDPLGLCPEGDEIGFRQLRRAEIKHGRVAMMAALGAVVQHFVRLPPFEDAVSGIKAFYTDPSIWGTFGLVLICGILEAIIWMEPEARLEDEPEIAMKLQPGDFGDPLGFGGFDKETRNKELNNGRFAMFASLGIIAAELRTGKDAVEQLIFWA